MYVQRAVRVRAVVRRGVEPRREIFRNLSGGKVDAHNRAVAYGRSDGYLRACANLHRGLGGRPITFLPLSPSLSPARERVHGMRTRGCASVHGERIHSVHRTITNEERGGARETREER